MNALLAICLTTYAAADVSCPEPPAWPLDLPAEIQADCGTCLPGKLADTVNERLRYLDAYPGLCQVAVDAQSDVCDVKIEQAIKGAQAEALEARVEASWPVGWTWWQVAVAVGAAALAGGIVGAVATH